VGRQRTTVGWDKVFYCHNVALGIDPFCYECTSHTNYPSGYVKTGRDGFNYMHRWIYWRITGERPAVVMHLCDNPKCINPTHLKAATIAENQRDMALKGRANGYKGKLSNEQVHEIRALRQEGVLLKDLMKMFNCGENTILRIIFKRTYKEVA
jgi:hypothetical protein